MEVINENILLLPNIHYYNEIKQKHYMISFSLSYGNLVLFFNLKIFLKSTQCSAYK